MYAWKDKVVLITGAANGIGACVARLVLEEGAKHIALLDVDKAGGETLQNDLNSKHGPCKTRFYPCDVTNEDQLLGAFYSLEKEQGYIDVVINNAAIMNDSPEMYKSEIAINFTALVTSTLKALEMMRFDKGGKGGTVINISSIAALRRTSFTPIYGATKAAVVHFSNCIGKGDFFLKTGIRVLTVCFGVTTTALSTAEKMGSYDDETLAPMHSRMVSEMYFQKPESAAAGVVAAYKHGASGSTWVATRDLPARDISDNVSRAYQILGEHNQEYK